MSKASTRSGRWRGVRPFVESAVVPASGGAVGAARPLDDLADAAVAERRDPCGGVHLGAVAAGRRGPGAGQDGGYRRDDAGGECGVAEHRPPRDGRGRHDVPDAAGRGVGHSDADAGRAGAVRPIAHEENVERRMDPSARSGCAGHDDERRADAPGPQGRAYGGPGDRRGSGRNGAGRRHGRHGVDGRDADRGGRAGRRGAAGGGGHRGRRRRQGYHSNDALVDLTALGLRSYLSEPD